MPKASVVCGGGFEMRWEDGVCRRVYVGGLDLWDDRHISDGEDAAARACGI